MSTPRGDKGKKGSFGKKSFSKTAPLSRVRTPVQPHSSKRTNQRSVRSITKKSDKSYSFVTNEYEIENVYYKDEYETVLIVQKKSGEKNISQKYVINFNRNSNDYTLLWFFI